MPKKADLDPIQAGLAEELHEETEPVKKTRKRIVLRIDIW